MASWCSRGHWISRNSPFTFPPFPTSRPLNACVDIWFPAIFYVLSTWILDAQVDIEFPANHHWSSRHLTFGNFQCLWGHFISRYFLWIFNHGFLMLKRTLNFPLLSIIIVLMPNSTLKFPLYHPDLNSYLLLPPPPPPPPLTENTTSPLLFYHWW